MQEETIFDKILKKQLRSDNVFENEHVLAFRDISPQAPVHIIVIPKKKVDRLSNISSFLSTEDMGYFLAGISEAARAVGLNENGYRVVINNGSDGQQTVEYLHAHILGSRKLSWPPG